MDGPPGVCSRCVCDTTIGNIHFDEEGVCNFCKVHDKLEKQYLLNETTNARLDKLVSGIRKAGQGKRYDCIVGVSGGTDSTFTLYKSKELGLRPLAVHLNNTWNTTTAEDNIKRAVSALDVVLQEIHCDWPEFKALQISFLKASVPEAEIPTDVAIHAILLKTAAKEGVHYVLNGHSFRTEGVAPIAWTYMDGRYIRSVHKHFGGAKLRSFPNINLSSYFYYSLIKRIKAIPFLNYFDYSKERAREVLEKELGWKYYGGHHFESVYTRFIIVHVLYKKFGIDKRKTGFSAHIRSGQMTREEALGKLSSPPAVPAGIAEECIAKLGLSHDEFEAIMQDEPKSFHDYPTYYPVLRATRPLIKLACKLRLVPPILYEKFFG